MARGWRYTKLYISSSLLLSFLACALCLKKNMNAPRPSPFFFCHFCFCFYALVGSLELCRCFSDIFLSSRPRTELATAYITGYC